jgi:hypothetical protein
VADSILIWELPGSNMLGSWTEEIVCTRRKNGSYSLRFRKRGEDGTRSGAGKFGINSPEAFVGALLEIGEITGSEISGEEIADEICPRLDQLDRKFSQQIRAYIDTLIK